MYDNNGNILSQRTFVFTLKEQMLVEEMSCTEKEYFYQGDRLMSYNGESFVYDVIGNPTTYRGKTATWANGRQLVAYDGHTFTYDGRGRRLSRDNTTFVYDDSGRLIQEGNMEFLYDHTGLSALKYFDTVYFYRKDVYGNITAILNSSGEVMGRYVYDAWGNHEVTDANCAPISDPHHPIHVNPFRYRGYYFDTVTNLYFLKTRYYDPALGRFMTIDGIEYLDPETINGLNLYAYCGNNPVMFIDSVGTFFITALLVGLIVGAVVGGVAAGVTAYNNGARGWDLVGQTLFGVVGGAIIGGAIGAAIGFVAPTIGSLLGSTFGVGGFALAGGGTAVAAISITEIAAIGLAALVGLQIMFSKTSRSSGKERATDKPSWVNRGMLDDGKSALENATDMLNNKYGKGNWHVGPGSEFSKIIKWLKRGLGFK